MKRHLRIGVLRDRRLVDDRYVAGGPVTVGSSAKSLVSLVGSRLPPEHRLFELKPDQLVLHLTEQMRGEIAVDGTTRESLDALRARGEPDGSGVTVRLPLTAVGWVQLADATFFFQIADRPAPPPRQTLPKAARTGLLSGLETTFVAILFAVLTIEGAAVLAIHRRPMVELDQPSVENLDRFAEIIMPEKPKDEPKPKEDEAAKKKAEEEARKRAEEAKQQAEETKKADSKNEPPPQTAEAAAARKQQVRDAVAKKGLLNVLTSAGGAGGSLSTVLSGGLGTDISEALAGAGGVQVATGNDLTARRGASVGGDAATIGDLGNAVQGGSGRGQLAEKKAVVAPQISFDGSEVEIDSATIDRTSLNRYVMQRKSAVTMCYERELKRNPSLKGKITIRFVILPTGRIGEVSVDENTMGDDNVAACIVSKVRMWSFPFKPEEDVPVSFPFVFSPGG